MQVNKYVFILFINNAGSKSNLMLFIHSHE